MASGRLNQFLSKCEAIPAMPTAVVHPVKANILKAVAHAAKSDLIVPILVRPAERILEALG